MNNAVLYDLIVAHDHKAATEILRSVSDDGFATFICGFLEWALAQLANGHPAVEARIYRDASEINAGLTANELRNAFPTTRDGSTLFLAYRFAAVLYDAKNNTGAGSLRFNVDLILQQQVENRDNGCLAYLRDYCKSMIS